VQSETHIAVSPHATSTKSNITDYHPISNGCIKLTRLDALDD